jgi:hypothetical protein
MYNQKHTFKAVASGNICFRAVLLTVGAAPPHAARQAVSFPPVPSETLGNDLHPVAHYNLSELCVFRTLRKLSEPLLTLWIKAYRATAENYRERSRDA